MQTFKEYINEAKQPKAFIKKADKFNYAVQINGVDNEFPSYPFGRQLDDAKKVKKWKETAKKAYVGAKGKATMAAVKAWIKENKPAEFYAKWQADSSSYKDDSVEIFYKDSVSEALSSSDKNLVKKLEKMKKVKTKSQTSTAWYSPNTEYEIDSVTDGFYDQDKAGIHAKPGKYDKGGFIPLKDLDV